MVRYNEIIMDFVIKDLSPKTWFLFEALAKKHNGVWGGCWCTWFHQSNTVVRGDSQTNHDLKYKLINEGKSHAALVCLNNRAIAWCQYGPVNELPAIYHKSEVEKIGYQKPDWRITCIFVDKDYRHQGVAKIAVEGALMLIQQRGGGLVESYPQDTNDEKVSSSFLYNATKSLFLDCGFEYIEKKGKNHVIVRKKVKKQKLDSKNPRL